jgi:sodium-coupled neutral amino acid transporter 10
MPFFLLACLLPAVCAGVTVVGALPVCLVVRDHALIAALSNASVVFVVIFAGVVFCTAFAPYAAAALGFHWAATPAAAANTAAATAAAAAGTGSGAAAAAATLMPPVLHMWHVQGVLVSLPVMAYGFTAHQYYMGIYTMLKAPSVRKMKYVTDLALLICAGVYWTVGVGGYATFGERTAGDIIRNLGGQRTLGLLGAYARALKLCYGMAILGNIPLVIMPFYSILKPLLPADEQILQGTANLAGSCSLAGAKAAAAAAMAADGSPLSGCAGALGAGSYANRSCSPLRSSSGLNLKAAVKSGVKLKMSCGGEELMEGGNGAAAAAGFGVDYEGGNGMLQQQQQPLLQPPTWQEQQQELLQRQQQQAYHQQQLDPHLATEQAAYVLTGMQHALVVFLVLGLGLASAVWLPNVELIFGLTGSTASVLVAFIIPAICFIKLYESAPELGGGSSSWESSGPRGVLSAVCYICCGCCGIGSWLASLCSSSSSAAKGHGSPSSSNGSSSSGIGVQQQYHSPVKGQVLVVPELRAQWMCRHRLAVLLLVFGVIRCVARCAVMC